MPFPLSPQTIETLAEVISGGSAHSGEPPIGIYRSGPKLERFMRTCNVDFSVGSASRLPALTECIVEINRGDDAAKLLPRIIEAAADPRDFVNDPERHTAVLTHLNRILAYDGFTLQQRGGRFRLVEGDRATPVLEQLAGKAETISFDTVKRDLGRAMASAREDPEDAITGACSTVESVCRSILFELGEPLPDKKDVKGLYNAVKKPLGLGADRPDLDPTIADDVRKVLSGLATTIEGIGALRTHAGDAHGRERGYGRVDERIATLAIHAASTVALFLIETWQRKFPTRSLPHHGAGEGTASPKTS